MYEYDSLKSKLELINKIQDLHLRHKCLAHFYLRTFNNYKRSDVKKIIQKTGEYINQTKEEISKSKNQEEYDYKVITPDIIYEINDEIISQAVKKISFNNDPRIKKREYDVLLPFCEDETLVFRLKRRIWDAEKEINVNEMRKENNKNDYYYIFNDDTFSDKRLMSEIELIFKSYKYVKNKSEIKFYNPKLYYILNIQTPISVVNSDCFNEVSSIVTAPYLEAYTKEFNKGVDDFDKEYSFLKNVFHANQAMVINTLKTKFYPQTCTSQEHWSKVYNFNNSISFSSVKLIAYKSGLVSRMWDFIHSLNIDINIFVSPFYEPSDTVDDMEALRIFLSIIESNNNFKIRFDKLKKELKKTNTDIEDGVEILKIKLLDLKKEYHLNEKSHNDNEFDFEFKFNVWVNKPLNKSIIFKLKYFSELTDFFEKCTSELNKNTQLKNDIMISSSQEKVFEIFRNYVNHLDYQKKYNSDFSTWSYYHDSIRLLDDLKTEIKLFSLDSDDFVKHNVIEKCLIFLEKDNKNHVLYSNSETAMAVLHNCNLSIHEFFKTPVFNKNIVHEFRNLTQYTYSQLNNFVTNDNIFEIHKSFFALISKHYTIKLKEYLNSIQIINTPPKKNTNQSTNNSFDSDRPNEDNINNNKSKGTDINPQITNETQNEQPNNNKNIANTDNLDIKNKLIIATDRKGTVITSDDSLDEKNVIFNSIQEIHNYIYAALSQIELFIFNKTPLLQYYELQNSFTELFNFINQPYESNQNDLDLCMKYFKFLLNLENKISDYSTNSDIDFDNKLLQRYLDEIKQSKNIVSQILDNFNLLVDENDVSILKISQMGNNSLFSSNISNDDSNQKKQLLTSNSINDAFENSFNDKQKEYILKLIEDLSITKDGKYCLSNRKKSAIRGVVEALRDHNFIPDIGLQNLCRVIAVKIKLDLPSNLDCSETSKKYLALAKKRIKNNPLH